MRKFILLAAIVAGIGVAGTTTETAQAFHRPGCGYGYGSYNYGYGGYGYRAPSYRYQNNFYRGGYGYGSPYGYYGGRNFYRGSGVYIQTPGFGFSYFGR